MAHGLKIDAKLVRPHDLGSFLGKLSSPVIATAAARGLTEHAHEQRRTSIVRIVAYTGIPTGRVAGKMTVKPAKPGPAMQAIVESADSATMLGEYGGVEWHRSMPGARVMAWNRSQILKGTFAHGGRVYVREGRSRKPIVQLAGAVIPNELSKPERPNVPAAEAYVALDLMKRVNRHIMVALGT